MKVISPQRRRRSGGFSLAELMVVIVIIGLLATVVLPNVWKNVFTANRGVVKQSLVTLFNAAENYSFQHNGKWPESLQVLVERDADGTSYLRQSEVPKDPWGNEYLYEPPRPGEAKPRIYTYGADGAPGGEGEDLDIYYQMVLDDNFDED